MGPDARLAPNEEPAITTAIQTWESRRNDPIFFPYEGTRFNSFEEAKEFYNLYSWEVGFGIRISRGRKNENGYITKKDLCCSCEGKCPNKKAITVCAKLSQDNIKDDLAKTMRLLEEMKSADSNMDVRFKLDPTGRIMRMLWCTEQNKERYKQFGDAVTFDTTYRTNLYNLPFGVFVGVNNHFQSTIFGGVLLTNEKTEDFEWAFKNFIEIMGGKEPQTILTYQCQAMAAAIRTTMKQSRHRWCKWHVLRKAKQWIGNAYSKKGGFKKEFHRLVTDEVSPQKFERRWRQLIRKYKLEKNKFLNRIYNRRGMWARPYFMTVFCAGMTSTQRSESANHMLKQFIQRSAPMHLFVSKFNELQNDRIEQEDREVHLTKQVRRRHRVGVPIERHAEEIYTRALYEKFSNELYYSGSYCIRQKIGGTAYKVAHYKEPDVPEQRCFTVEFDIDGSIKCSCGLFEHSGMLCRHCLKVLVHLEVAKIPDGNIMHRWTKSATSYVGSDLAMQTATNGAQTEDYIRKQLFLKRVLAATGVDRRISEGAVTGAISALDKLSIMRENSATDSQIPKACPERPVRKGRPNNTSLRCYEIEVKKKKQNRRKTDETSGPSSTDEENPKTGKPGRLKICFNRRVNSV